MRHIAGFHREEGEMIGSREAGTGRGEGQSVHHFPIISHSYLFFRLMSLSIDCSGQPDKGSVQLAVPVEAPPIFDRTSQ